MHVIAPEETSTCRSRDLNGEWIEKTYDYVIECGTLKGEISQMKVVEDFDSRQHKAVSFVVDRERRRFKNGTSRSCRR